MVLRICMYLMYREEGGRGGATSKGKCAKRKGLKADAGERIDHSG